MTQVGTLEEELQHGNETHQEKEKSLQDQTESLQQRLKHKVGTGAKQAIKTFLSASLTVISSVLSQADLW